MRRAEALQARGLLRASERYSVVLETPPREAFIEPKEEGRNGMSAADAVKREWEAQQKRNLQKRAQEQEAATWEGIEQKEPGA